MKKIYATKSLTHTKALQLIVFAILLISSVSSSFGQVRVPFTPRTSALTTPPGTANYNIKGDFTMIGNTNLTLDSYTDGGSNADFMKYVDIDNDSNTLNSSSAVLGFSTENSADPSCSNIIYAGLYWTGRAHSDGASPNTFNTEYSEDVRDNDNILNTDYSLNINDRYFTFTTNGSGDNVRLYYNNNSTIQVQRDSGSGWSNTTNLPYDYDNFLEGRVLDTPYLVYDGQDFKLEISFIRINNSSSRAYVNVITKIKTLDKHKVSIKGPASVSYTELIAEPSDIYYPSNTDGNMYSAYSDITDYVQTNGLGEYFVADIATSEGSGDGIGYYGGWGMVVVYENSKMNWRDVTIFDGHAYVKSPPNNTNESHTLNVSGFNAVDSGNVNIKLGLMAGEGDVEVARDYFQIEQRNSGNYSHLNHSGNQPTGNTPNFFNSSINTGGNARTPNLQNNTGIDIAMFDVPNLGNSIIDNGQTQTSFRYGSDQDTYVIFNMAFSVDAYVPIVEGILSTVSINGNSNPSNLSLLPGESADYQLEIKNTGTEGTNNTVITLPVPYTSTYQNLSINYDTPSPFFSATNVPTYDPNLGATGSIVWDLGSLPALLPDNDPQTILATLGFTLNATTDCSLLVNANCDSVIALGGSISGTGSTSSVDFEHQLIQGYETTGNCIGEPIPTPNIITIDSEQYVADNCGSYTAVRDFYYCNIGSTPIQTSQVSAQFPPGSRYYNQYPTIDTSIEYNASNPFPPTLGTATYYAVPPGSPTCYYQFTINVSDVVSIPTVQDITYCLNETAVPLTATPSDSPTNPSAFTLYYYTDNNPSTTGQTSILPSTTTAGVTTYYVAEGLSNSCISPNRVPIKVTVYDTISITLDDSTDATCVGGNDGSIDISVVGGSGNYTYDWSYNGAEDPDTDSKNLTNIGAGSHTVTVTDIDANGCTISKTFVISDGADDENPTIVCPSNITQTADAGQCGADVTITNPTANDNCSTTYTFVGNRDDSLALNADYPVGTTTITWTAEDAAGNISTSCTQTVTVTDDEDPTINCPATININVDAGIDGAVVNYTAPVGTDNCTGETTTQIAGLASGVLFPIGTTTNTFQVTDAAGNTTTCSFDVIVTDDEDPTINCPATMNVNVDAGIDGAVVNYTTPVGTDNGSGTVTTTQIAGLASGVLFPIGTTTNTFQVTDAAGNTTTCSFDVIVTDDEDPTINCLSPINQTADTGVCGAIITYITPVGTDNASGSTTVQTTGLPSGSLFPVGTTTNTFLVTDASGNTATCNFDVIITDDELPTITCPADVSINVDPASCEAANVTLGTPTTTDNCSGVSVTNDAPDTFPLGNTTVIWTVTDDSGNSVTCEQTVTVTDNINPTFVETLPIDDTVECNAIPDAATLTATDNCETPDVIFQEEKIDGSCISNYTIKRTWIATDASGLTTTHTQTITVQDTTRPLFVETLPGDTTVECDAVPDAETLTATDNCSMATVSVNDVVTAGNCTNNYIIERTWTATDECGLETKHTQTITVQDTTAPTPTTTFDKTLDVSCADVSDAPSLEFSDNCSSSTNITVTFEETNTFDENVLEDYQIIRTWTVSDECNNEEVYTQTLNVSLDEIITDIIAEDRCFDDGVVDLNDLITTTDSNGTWELLEGDATATLTGSVFDPTTLELSHDFLPGSDGIDYKFKYTTTEYGCISIYEVTMNVHAECVVLPCGENDIEISKALTPNGDGFNETFDIAGIDLCGFVANVKIFNRWGALVYSSDNYTLGSIKTSGAQGDWNGASPKSSIGSSGKLPNGTYYYIINLENSGLKPLTGPIYLGTK